MKQNNNIKNKQQDKQPTVKKAFLNATKGFVSIFPIILAVIGLIGLSQVYITSEMLSTLFGFSSFLDTIIGTLIGAISSGNGAISYVVAQGLQEQGVSLYALSSFILAWVTLGFVHLPAESSVFGVRFTVYRNILTLISTILIIYLTITSLKFFT